MAMLLKNIVAMLFMAMLFKNIMAMLFMSILKKKLAMLPLQYKTTHMYNKAETLFIWSKNVIKYFQ